MRSTIGVAIVAAAIVAIVAIAGDWTSVEYFVTGRRCKLAARLFSQSKINLILKLGASQAECAGRTQVWCTRVRPL
jgi:hypothetical protein